MKSEFYTLPELNFVGGSTQDFVFTMQTSTGNEYDLPSSTFSFAVTDFVNHTATPILKKEGNLTQSDTATSSIVEVKLVPNDTKNMAGKYEYQITVIDEYGNVSIPNNGIMYVEANIDKSALD